VPEAEPCGQCVAADQPGLEPASTHTSPPEVDKGLGHDHHLFEVSFQVGPPKSDPSPAHADEDQFPPLDGVVKRGSGHSKKIRRFLRRQ